MKKILVIAAHPDDEILGCGGTMARHVKKGNKVYTLILGEGITARDDTRDTKKRKKELIALKESAHKANRIIGVKKVFIYDFPDNRFDTVALLDIVKVIEKIKNKIKPQIIYTHHQGDLNIDHKITYNAVLTACRPLKDETVKKIYSFEVPSSTEWVGPKEKDYFMPNVFIDISNSFNKKIEALKAYKSEICQYPHPRSLKALEIIARRWGTTVGKGFVEAFELIREITN